MATQPNPPPPSGPPNLSAEFAKLKSSHSNNKHMLRLPPNATIQKRPILHPPIASPFAGARVPKVVYVSSKTPFMSAVKRVRRLLLEIEKRGMKDVKLVERGERDGLKRLGEAKEKVGREGEELLVKASGRACGRAVEVGKWFKTKEVERLCEVEVRVGSVSVVDDVVEVEKEVEDGEGMHEDEGEGSKVEEGDTTMELLGDGKEVSTSEPSGVVPDEAVHIPVEDASTKPVNNANDKKSNRRRRKRKRPVYDADDLPEQRLRWVKTVEVAISIKA